MSTRPTPLFRIRRSAFTLIEVLVVMGIIVLLIALALPAFSFITGSRSTEAASNQISAALSIARAQAIGLQKIAGVMFFTEPTSDRIQLALVQETARPPGTGGDIDAGVANIGVYLDLVDNTEFVKLPVGVGVQTVTNPLPAPPATANTDRYIGFNTDGIGSAATAQSGVLTKVGGVILFDGNGSLITQTYALRSRRDSLTPNRMGALLFYNADPTAADDASRLHTPSDYIPSASMVNAPISQIGFVLFNNIIFDEKFRSSAIPDPSVDYRAYTALPARLTAEQAKEQWLDENGLPTMINRYNGTLVAGE